MGNAVSCLAERNDTLKYPPTEQTHRPTEPDPPDGSVSTGVHESRVHSEKVIRPTQRCEGSERVDGQRAAIDEIVRCHRSRCRDRRSARHRAPETVHVNVAPGGPVADALREEASLEIGRASCRERV